MKVGIALKLGWLLAGVSILASGLTGFYAYQASRNLLVQSAKEELLTTAQVLARRVTLNREEISRNLQVLSNHPAALAALRPLYVQAAGWRAGVVTTRSWFRRCGGLCRGHRLRDPGHRMDACGDADRFRFCRHGPVRGHRLGHEPPARFCRRPFAAL